MKALKIKNPLKISIIPRKYPLQNDTLSVSLRNEISNQVLTPNFTFTVGQKLEITFASGSLTAGKKFAIEVKNANEIIYLGKLETFAETKNIQKNAKNTRFIFK